MVMNEVRVSLYAYVAFQMWEAFVFLLAFAGGMIALEDAGLIVLSSYAEPVHFGFSAVLAFFWHRLLIGLDLYASQRLVRRDSEIVRVLFAVVLSAAFLALIGALMGGPINQAPFLIWFMLVAMVLIGAGRLVVRVTLRTARAFGRNLRFVVIVGTGPKAQALVRYIEDNPQMGFRVHAIFDVAQDLAKDPKTRGMQDLAQLLRREAVDEVLINLPMGSHYAEVGQVLTLCQCTGVSARLVSEILMPGSGLPKVEMVGNRACLHFCATPNWGWQGRAKRVFDLVGAGAGLLVLSPLLLAAAVMIRLDSKGPVLFTQTRVGKNRQHFRLYKFRTMVQDAEALQAALEAQNEASGPVFKIRRDPRITSLGHFLRKYSIDELPQLLNVLRGDMSLVGPRPLPLRDVERFDQDWYSRRFSVRPGLTCSWVLAGRSELEFEAWVRNDLDYIDRWSLQGDVMICLRTIPVVLRGAGAY